MTALPFQHILLLGGPGTGKTYVTLLALAFQEHFFPGSVRRTAFMNSAARLLGGSTLHSAMKLPAEDPGAVVRRSVKEDVLEAWKLIDVLAIDEISMVSAELFGTLELRAQQVKKKPGCSWGGLSCFFIGDFMQLPPVAATSLAVPDVPPPGHNASQNATNRYKDALRGLDLWNQVTTIVHLNYSHRAHGSLETFLASMRGGHIPQASWSELNARLLQPGDPRISHPKYWTAASCIGVLRHNVRVLAGLHRALALAQRAKHRLIVCIAVDTCHNARHQKLQASEFLQFLARLPNLNSTQNLPGYLFLWPGARVSLEHKLLESKGLVRGCELELQSILLDDREPPFQDDPTLEPHILEYVPEGLLLHVPDADNVQQSSHLPSNTIYLDAISRNWSFSPKVDDIAGLDDASRACAVATPLHVTRRQFPCTNTLARTAYNLEGRTLPALVADIARPPGMPRVTW